MYRAVRRATSWFSAANRRRKAAVVSAFCSAEGVKSALFVGIGGDEASFERIVETAVAKQLRFVVACDVDHEEVPWKFVRADGRRLPFRDNAFDLVFSNAVVEHVGEAREQEEFVGEHGRVGMAWAMTTPNRWFPLEPHTLAMLRHWNPAWRATRPEFTRLLSLPEFRNLLPANASIRGRFFSPTFIALCDERSARDTSRSEGPPNE